MILSIDVVFIHVKDSELMANWYQEKLGLDIKNTTPDLSWQEFALSENQVPTRFALDYGGSNPSLIEQQPIIISFKVADIYKAVNELEKRAVIFSGSQKVLDVGPTLVATFQDPEGNYLQISQRKE
ncbi:MAG: VOC family protein [Candidatus Heimdallarchaeota archaeon]